ncbi:MAG TPA: GNAT family N-acetyltransferase [Gaiellaceae bacterium]|nr:GNAT family N-acetyltransferase [Gaiellaceae bacterium]
MAVRPPDPPLTDGVVKLRPWGEDGDVEALVAACNDPEIASFLDAIPQPYTRSDAAAYLELCRVGWRDGSITNFAIVLSGPAVGSVGVRMSEEPGVAEVGYWVAAQARGQRVCTRAVRLVARWLLEERRLARLQLRADERNVASNRVAQNAGFTREGVLRSSHYNPRLDRRVDFVMYSLLPGEL